MKKEQEAIRADDRNVKDAELLVKLLELVDDILRASSLDLSVHCLNLLGRKRDCVAANPVLRWQRAFAPYQGTRQ